MGKIRNRKPINMIGYTFQNWKVISQSSKMSKNHNTYWNCQCQECGREKTLCGSEIRLGRTAPCRHKDKITKSNKVKKLDLSRIIDETNNHYGFLTVLSLAKAENGQAYWLCKCECGNNTIVRGNHLRSHAMQSCGCQNSYKELEISNILQKNNISYKREYTFSDLYDKGLLRFDFAIFHNNDLIGLIEYQGSQHYEANSKFNQNGRLQIHDQMKKDYCNSKGINLLELNKNDELESTILNWLSTLH